MLSFFIRLQKKTQQAALAAEAEKATSGTGRRTRVHIRSNSQIFAKFIHVAEKLKKKTI